MSDTDESGSGIGQRLRSVSRPTLTLLVLGGVLVVLAVTGVLRADRDLEITSERAVEIARPEIDFEPEQTTVRLVRQGIDLEPVWAVSFSIQGEEAGFDRLSVVRVDAGSGEILGVDHDE